MLLDPGLKLTLRPMGYPRFYEMYRNAIKRSTSPPTSPTSPGA
jgi:ribonucleoside-diphosphate reductase beta chain